MKRVSDHRLLVLGSALTLHDDAAAAKHAAFPCLLSYDRPFTAEGEPDELVMTRLRVT